MRNLNPLIEIPKPSRFVTHRVVDEIANEIAQTFCAGSDKAQNVLDVEDFILGVLEKKVVWSPIPEPANRVCFASLDNDRITINENHRTLFKEKSFLLRSCLSHEVGHEVLRHLEVLTTNENQACLFDEGPVPRIALHDSAWRQLGVTPQELTDVKNKLAKTALVDPESRRILNLLSDKLEPEWMYYQAEQFGGCFLIPKFRLFEILETGMEISNWSGIYRLAEKFGVSVSMMRVRLEKLKLIEVIGKDIKRIPQEKGRKLNHI